MENTLTGTPRYAHFAGAVNVVFANDAIACRIGCSSSLLHPFPVLSIGQNTVDASLPNLMNFFAEDPKSTDDSPGKNPRSDGQWTRPPLWDAFYLTGPTASGKTQAGVELAERLGAEIISLDSMAVYRGMDIGTAKPAPEQVNRIAHHLIDIVEPIESYSVSRYVDDVHRTAEQIRQRGKRVLLVGGTPLYLKSLLRGLFLGPPPDQEFRDAVEADIEIYGMEALRERLWQVDPLSAHKLHPNDKRRMIRALEVAKTTGRPLSHWQIQFENPAPKHLCKVMVLGLERGWLHQRINQRVDSMFENGLVSEVRGLLDRFGGLGPTASQAVGYREVLQHLDGELDLPQTQLDVQAHTRQFARRQEIWFRSLEECQRIEVTPQDTAETLAERLIGCCAESQ